MPKERYEPRNAASLALIDQKKREFVEEIGDESVCAHLMENTKTLESLYLNFVVKNT